MYIYTPNLNSCQNKKKRKRKENNPQIFLTIEIVTTINEKRKITKTKAWLWIID